MLALLKPIPVHLKTNLPRHEVIARLDEALRRPFWQLFLPGFGNSVIGRLYGSTFWLEYEGLSTRRGIRRRMILTIRGENAGTSLEGSFAYGFGDLALLCIVSIIVAIVGLVGLSDAASNLAQGKPDWDAALSPVLFGGFVMAILWISILIANSREQNLLSYLDNLIDAVPVEDFTPQPLAPMSYLRREPVPGGMVIRPRAQVPKS